MPSAYTATVNAIDYGFDFIDKEIEIDATAASAVATDLKVAIREAEASQNGIVFEQVGFMGNPVVLDPSGPISTALSVVLLSTWRLLSLRTSGTFTMGGGNTVNVTTGADIFAANLLTTMINNLSQAGVITSVGSGLSAGEQAQLARIDVRNTEEWQRLGLDPDNPLKTHDDNAIDIGPDGTPIIEIEAVNDPTSTTQTRTP